MKHWLIVVALTLVLPGPGEVTGQAPFQYREFRLGSDLSTVTKETGATPASARILHERPAVIAELEWRPRYSGKHADALTDPVGLIRFRFYDDKLFQILVDYDAQRTEGMTAADMIEAVASTYGPVSRTLGADAPSLDGRFGLPDTPLAIWNGPEHSLLVSRVVYPAAFRLTIVHTALEKLARSAMAAAAHIDALEAPARQRALLKKSEDDAKAAREKAKTENIMQFRP